MATTVWCNDSEGAQTIMTSQPKHDGECTVTQSFNGPAGCPYEQTLLQSGLTWFEENTWALATILLIAGPIVAFQGLVMFPYVAAAMSALFAMGSLWMVCESFKWTESNNGYWICFSLVALAGIGTAVLITKNIWVTVGILGAFGGVIAGVLLLDVIAALFAWGPTWFLWVLAVLGGIAGFFFAKKTGPTVVNLSTSFIGSYLFMRSLTIFFWPTHWPSEKDIINGDIATEEFGW